MSKKGFTLIELLVVIAIIGILSSIVLVSLGGARTKAKDARIQADVSQLRAISEMIYADTNGYTALCTGNDLVVTGTTHNYISQVATVRADLLLQIGTLTPGTNIACQSTASAYCVSVDLQTTGIGFHCIDSAGLAKVVDVITCTAANTDCTP